MANPLQDAWNARSQANPLEEAWKSAQKTSKTGPSMETMGAGGLSRLLPSRPAAPTRPGMLPTVTTIAEAPTHFEERFSRQLLAAQGKLGAPAEAEEAMRGQMEREANKRVEEGAKAVVKHTLDPRQLLADAVEAAKLTHTAIHQGDFWEAAKSSAPYLIPFALEGKEMAQAARAGIGAAKDVASFGSSIDRAFAQALKEAPAQAVAAAQPDLTVNRALWAREMRRGHQPAPYWEAMTEGTGGTLPSTMFADPMAAATANLEAQQAAVEAGAKTKVQRALESVGLRPEVGKPRKRLGALEATPEEVEAYQNKLADDKRAVDALINTQARQFERSELQSAWNKKRADKQFAAISKDIEEERLAEQLRSGELHPDQSKALTPEELADPENLKAEIPDFGKVWPMLARPSSVKAGPKALSKMTDRQLEAAQFLNSKELEAMQGVEGWDERMGDLIYQAGFVPSKRRINQYGETVIDKTGKQLVSPAELRRNGAYMEDELGAAEEWGLDSEKYHEMRQQVSQLEKTRRQVNARSAAIESELRRRAEQRGLQNRPGAASTPVVSALGGAAAGGTIGALSAEPGDKDSAFMRGLLGAAAGGFAGAKLGGIGGKGVKAAEVAPEIFPPRATPLTGPVNPELYTNAAKFSESPTVQQRLLDATEEMVRNKTVPLRLESGRLAEPETFDALRQRVAKDLNLDVSEIATRTKRGEALTRDDMLRVKTALDKVMDEEDALNLKIRNKDYGSAEDLAMLQTQLNRIEGDRRALMEAFTTHRTETARNLSALRIASLRNFDPVAWEENLKKFAQRELTDAERTAVRAAAKDKDAQALTQLAAQVRKSTLGEKLGAMFQTNILTSAATHVANIGGNMTALALDQLKNAPAAVLDRLISLKTGVRTKSFNPAEAFRASMEGASKGVKEFGPIMRGELTPGLKLGEVPREVNWGDGILGSVMNKYTNMVGRSLSAEDNVFKNVVAQNSLNEQARVLAKAEKLTGEAFKNRVAELIANPTDEMALNAKTAADFVTFQGDSKLVQTAQSLRRSMGLPGTVLFPFVKTPVNIAIQTAYHYTPLAWIGELKNLGKVLLGKEPNANLQRSVVEAYGRGSVGAGAMMLGYELAKNGKMTGFFPARQRERDEWEQQGKMEGSVKHKNTWVQVNRLSPLGNLMQIGAAIYDMQHNPDANPWLTTAGAALAPLRTVAELPMASNLKDLIDAGMSAGSENPEDAVASLMQIGSRSVTGFVPFAGAIRSVGRVMDPTVRETKDPSQLQQFKNQLKAQIPGLSKTLPEKVEPMGTVVQREGGLMNLINPIQTRQSLADLNPLRGEMSRVGAVAGRIKREKTESGEAFAEREKQTGSTIARVMQAVMASPQYQAIPLMNVGGLRSLLQQAGQSTESLTDDQLRQRVQRLVLESAMSQTKTALSQARPQPIPSAARSLVKSLARP